MSRVLRGAWSRRGALTTLVLMTVVVVGGAVTVLQFAEAAGTSRWLTAPLLLLGAVAVPSIGAELAVALPLLFARRPALAAPPAFADRYHFRGLAELRLYAG